MKTVIIGLAAACLLIVGCVGSRDGPSRPPGHLEQTVPVCSEGGSRYHKVWTEHENWYIQLFQDHGWEKITTGYEYHDWAWPTRNTYHYVDGICTK